MNAQTARSVTLVVGVICGALALFATVQRFGVGRGYHWNTDAENTPPPLPAGRIDREVAALAPESQFIGIQNRPLFNDDRKPTPPEAVEIADEDAPPQVPLNVILTGIIITPEVKLAMLRANGGRAEPVSLREGMPLPGDQSVWTVVEIQPRKVVLKNGSDETSELPLDVSSVTPPAPASRVAAAPAPTTMPAGVPISPTGSDQIPPPPSPSDRAAELQKRIEERRREMREQAERLRQQQSQQMQQDQQTE